MIKGKEALKWLEERKGKLVLKPYRYPEVYEIFEETTSGEFVNTGQFCHGDLLSIAEYLK